MAEEQRVHPDADRFGGWHWRDPSHGEHFRRCSYCGSIHPADLAAEPAWVPEWADWKYGWPHKFYVDIPNRNPDALFVTSVINYEPAVHTPPVRGDWHTWDQLTPELRAVAERDGYKPGALPDPHRYMFGTRPKHWAKFYSVHAVLDPAVPDDVTTAIYQRSGIRLELVDEATARIAWYRATPPDPGAVLDKG